MDLSLSLYLSLSHSSVSHSLSVSTKHNTNKHAQNHIALLLLFCGHHGHISSISSSIHVADNKRKPQPSSVLRHSHGLAPFQCHIEVADQLLDVRQLKVQVRKSAKEQTQMVKSIHSEISVTGFFATQTLTSSRCSCTVPDPLCRGIPPGFSCESPAHKTIKTTAVQLYNCHCDCLPTNNTYHHIGIVAAIAFVFQLGLQLLEPFRDVVLVQMQTTIFHIVLIEFRLVTATLIDARYRCPCTANDGLDALGRFVWLLVG